MSQTCDRCKNGTELGEVNDNKYFCSKSKVSISNRTALDTRQGCVNFEPEEPTIKDIEKLAARVQVLEGVLKEIADPQGESDYIISIDSDYHRIPVSLMEKARTILAKAQGEKENRRSG